MESSLAGEFMDLDIEVLDASDWNPNQMDDKQFDRLVREIDESGMIDPIQVVPTDDGRYRIIGGHHRTNACKLLGYETIPCIVLNGGS